jgi:anti-sigma B factor antagonist
MELYHEIRTDAYVLILAGAVDESNATELNQALHKALKSQRDKIIVDCHKLAYISTAGIGILLPNLPHIREKGIQLIFEGMDEKTRHVFQVLGLDALLSLSDTSFAI